MPIRLQIPDFKLLFSNSTNDFNAGRYEVALAAFQNIIQPESSWARNPITGLPNALCPRKDDAEKAYLNYIKIIQGSKFVFHLQARIGIRKTEEGQIKTLT